ncbi:MAG: zinc ribbon domain-containing protein [Euryarchaeota archaeon]|nr:zinc ribbon domain-containing protein [Euryarchaeota archaeon]
MKYEERPQYVPPYYGGAGQPYQQPPQQGSRCWNCGALYDSGAQYCPRCGKRL